MDSRATPIAREDLLTPPEFRGLHPADHPAARVGGARIELVRNGDASLFAAGPVPEVLPEAGPALRRSVFHLDTGESCVRWCGHPSAVTADLVRIGLRLAAHWTLGPDAPPWLLASSSLAPNHWFSTPAEEGWESPARNPRSDGTGDREDLPG